MQAVLGSIVQFAVSVGPALLMIAVFVLVLGGVRIIRAGNRQKGVLMLVCALVFFVNVLLLTL
ncbi:hypothetical protein [Sphingobium boeckii]|uniref:Uncharacterized protein n=1 Tax=Sphingobium boeckii TaxID=1082345 RepID=A0A7W9EFB2_9SPHN|nr:hypothetical protein [Sphingobium boeckii]MBB5687138.1 hypothetical protein [Sphingobium boeckii]